jgi:hypothetical protein
MAHGVNTGKWQIVFTVTMTLISVHCRLTDVSCSPPVQCIEDVSTGTRQVQVRSSLCSGEAGP